MKSNHRLHLAAWSGHAEIVSYLCKNKADAGAAAMDDMGAIHFAAQKGHLEVIKILVASGVSVKSTNRKGMTALHYAAQGSNLELIKYLLKKGSNKSVKNKAGKSAVDLASSEEIHKLLSEFEFESKSDRGEKSGMKISSSKEEGEISDGNTSALSGDESAHEEAKDESVKRKSEEDDTEKSEVGSKKYKVALNHLLAADDVPEEEDDQ